MIETIPSEFSGQASAFRQLTAALDSPVGGYLFVGPTGSGKRSAACWFAGELFARGCGPEEADRARRLALAEQHPDLVITERKGAAISVDQVTEIVGSASLSPAEAQFKVLLLIDLHLAGKFTSGLLKTIEEASPTTMFIVHATDVVPELVTIASRCVRIDFSPVREEVILERLLSEGIDQELSSNAARSAGGDLGRARLLATDSFAGERHRAWSDAPFRLDGSGHAAAKLAEELLAMIASAAEPLLARQGEELAALEERIELTGERGAGRKPIEDRQKRERRRHRADELRAGLSAMAVTYRERAAQSDDNFDVMIRAGDLILDAVEAVPKNPVESLLVQATLIGLPPLSA